MARGNGEGSIYPHRKNGYRGAYTVHTPEGPKRRYVTGKDRDAVREKLTKAMADRDGGLIFDAGNLTVEEHVKDWLKDSARGTVRQSTFERYGQMVDLHIVPALGRIKLKALAPAHVRGLNRAKLDGSGGFPGLAPATVHKLHQCLRKALAQAVADGLIPRNACDALKLPRIDREEIDPLTAERPTALSRPPKESASEPSTCSPYTPGSDRGSSWPSVGRTSTSKPARLGFGAPSPGRRAPTPRESPRRRRAAARCASPRAPWPPLEDT